MIEDKEKTRLDFIERSKVLKKSLQKAMPLIGRNPILMEPRYMAMAIAIHAGDDNVLASEFNKFLKESGSLNIYDKKDLDKFFWDWLNHKYPDKFKSGTGESAALSGGGSLQRLGEALREELEEKLERENKIKIQHAKDGIRKELKEEFDAKIKEVMKNTGQTSKSLDTMDAIIEKAGKGALGLLSDEIESAKGSTNRIKNSADDLNAKVKKLEEEIQYDTIPGLYTVQVFSQKFREMADKFSKNKVPFSLAFMTIDRLNEYTSSSDPMITRKLFLGVARLIIDDINSRPTDILPARYDANLMGFLLPGTSLKEALDFSNKIRNMIKNQEFVVKGGQTLDLTISAGISEYLNSDTFELEEIPGGGKQLNSSVLNRAIGVLKKVQYEGGNRVGRA